MFDQLANCENSPNGSKMARKRGSLHQSSERALVGAVLAFLCGSLLSSARIYTPVEMMEVSSLHERLPLDSRDSPNRKRSHFTAQQHASPSGLSRLLAHESPMTGGGPTPTRGDGASLLRHTTTERRVRGPSQECIFELDDDEVLFEMRDDGDCSLPWTTRSPFRTPEDDGMVSDSTPSSSDGGSRRHASFSGRDFMSSQSAQVAGSLQRRAFMTPPSPVVNVRRNPGMSPSNVQRFLLDSSEPFDALLGVRTGYGGGC